MLPYINIRSNIYTQREAFVVLIRIAIYQNQIEKYFYEPQFIQHICVMTDLKYIEYVTQLFLQISNQEPQMEIFAIVL